MTGMDLEAAVDELYAAPAEEFVRTRSRLVAAAKAAGDKPMALDLAAMRKPTVAAWAVNRLVTQRGEDADRLVDLAERMRAAQQALDGALLKELSRERTELLEELVAAVSEVAQQAGVSLSAAGTREVGATFVAALASAQATAAVVSGRLTRTLEYAGFGEVDLHEATARPLHAVPDLPAPARTATPGPARGASPTGPDSAGGQRQPPLLQVLATPAESPELLAARAALALAEDQEAAASARLGALEDQVELAEARVASVQRELAKVLSVRDAAQAAYQTGEAAVSEARGRARRARAQVSALEADR